jgi:unsaturated rhamnogalacturonyl hydrolase
MKKIFPAAVLFLCGLFASQSSAQKPVVTLDCYHNTETPAHYTWQKVGLGGYSQFAQIILNLGADTSTLTTPLDSPTLSHVSVLFIVNPGKTATSNLIGAAEIDAVDKWVQQGGKLMCFANNTGHVEFVHYNQLMARFGITFNDTTQTGGSNFGPVPQNEVFSSCTTFYIVDMCNLTITAPAKSVFTFQGSVLMATALKGKGKVFATGDPWVYDEHIAAKDNIKGITQVMNWLLGTTTPVSRSIPGARQTLPQRADNGYQILLLNGRQVSHGGQTFSRAPAYATGAHGTVYISAGPNGSRQHVSLK